MKAEVKQLVRARMIHIQNEGVKPGKKWYSFYDAMVKAKKDISKQLNIKIK